MSESKYLQGSHDAVAGMTAPKCANTGRDGSKTNAREKYLQALLHATWLVCALGAGHLGHVLSSEGTLVTQRETRCHKCVALETWPVKC